MSRLPILFTCALLLTANAASAKDLFVTPTGNDAVSYASNSATTPWRSLGRATWGSTSISAPNAAEAAKAGDVVSVAAGTYATTSVTNTRYTPIYNPVNSGTATAPITIRAVGNVYLTSSAGGQPIIGTLNKPYIVWDGFILNEANITTTSDTGPLVVWGESSHHVTIQNMHIIGTVLNWGDNHNGIRLEYASDVLIRNNVIEGFADTVNASNATCLTTYDSYNIVIEHNECKNSNVGFFIKGRHGTKPQQNVVMRYNYVHNNSLIGLYFGMIGENNPDGSPAVMSNIYQNLITDVGMAGLYYVGLTTDAAPARVIAANNTIVRAGALSDREAGGILIHAGYTFKQLSFRNNLITNSATGVAAWDTTFNASPGESTFSNNNYYANGTGTGAARIAYTELNLASWQATYGKDTVGTTTLNPGYVSATDYRLTSTSPIKNTGLDVLDLNGNGSTSDSIAVGAYVTGNEVMGPTTETTVAAPNPPANLQVVP